MRRILPVVCAVITLTGCGPLYVRTDAPDVHIAQECLNSCDLTQPNISIDPASITDAVVTLWATLKQCDLKRQLCVQALKRARDAGAIK